MHYVAENWKYGIPRLNGHASPERSRIPLRYHAWYRPKLKKPARCMIVERASMFSPGKLGNSTPLRLYVVAILISANSSKVSSFVRQSAVNPLIMVVYRNRTRSSQPHRRLRPVVTPHSRPRVCKCSPISYRNQTSSMEILRAIYIFQFSGEYTITHTRCVRFDYTIDISDVFRC